jgi:DNA-binding MarR family transcriptional regulator
VNGSVRVAPLTLVAADVADQILDVVPRVMRRIRREMRAEGAPGLSIPQFRILVRVGRVPGLSLTSLADDLGMSASAASALVDRLVRAGELERTVDPDERRRIRLHLSSSGEARIAHARLSTQAWLSHTLSGLSDSELRSLATGLEALALIGESGQ